MNKKSSIKVKIRIGMISIIGITIISVLISLGALYKISSDYNDALKNYGFAQGDIGNLGMAFYTEGTIIRDIMSLKDEADIAKEIEKFKQVQLKLDELLVAVDKTTVSGKGREIYFSIKEALEEYQPISEEIIRLGTENKNDEAMNLYRTKAMPITDNINTNIKELMDLNIQRGNQVVKNVERLANGLLVGICVFLVAVIAGGLTLATRIANNISKPVGEIVDAAHKLAEGNLNFEISAQTNDEIGDLANSFLMMSSNLRQYINDIAHVTQEISNHNLNVSITREFSGDFVVIATSINRIIDTLNMKLKKINISADEVTYNTQQASEGAQALAEGTTEQSSVVEELVASINEVSEKVTENAANAKVANQMTVNAVQFIQESNDKMQEVIGAMDEIKETTSGIQAIIKTIEDISRQTNLLSLNAAIEAARVGEAGKGFAVVANEVKDLAEKSNAATKDTVELIERCIRASQNGEKIVSETAQSLSKVEAGANEAKENIELITNVSGEQAISLQQIVQGIEQISDIMQNNAAIAEESAATSENLLAQAETLKDLVNEFNLSNK